MQIQSTACAGLKVIIAGSRNISSIDSVKRAVALSGFKIGEVVSGMAEGIDTDAIEMADLLGVPLKPFEVTKAMWRRNPFKAGFIRNREMGLYADALVAVWDGSSGGTKDMIAIMRELGKPYYVLDLSKEVSANLLEFIT